MHRLCQKENGLDVEVHHLVPACFGEGLEGLAPGGACIVDQNINAGFMLSHCGGQRLATVDRRDVLWHGNTVGAQLLGDGFADIGFAAGDIHLGPLSDEAGGNHLADAP